MWLFYFRYGFTSSSSTADLLIVVSDRTAKTTGAIALDILKVVDRVWYAGLLHKLKSNEVLGQVFSHILSFLGNRKLQMVLDGTLLQEYPVNPVLPQIFILGLLFGQFIDDAVICNIAIYTDDATLYSK